jgi:hypothetical protein
MLTVSGAPSRATQTGGVKPVELVLSGAARRPTLRSIRHSAAKAAGQAPLVKRAGARTSNPSVITMAGRPERRW